MTKYVFSRTLDKAGWSNTTLIKDNLIESVTRLKQQSGEDLAILGSGSIAAQLAAAGLIDVFQFIVDPLAIGSGRSIFDGIKRTLPLKLTATRNFGNGSVYLCYEPAS